MAVAKGTRSLKKKAPGMEEMSVMSEPVQKSMADRLMPIMMVMILVMGLGMVYLFMKLQNGGGTTTGTGKYKTFEAAMKDLAKKAGVKDQNKLIKCMNLGDKKASAIDPDVAEGTALGVSGTPAFFINGRLIPGAVPIEEFKKVIDQELGTKAMDATVDRKTANIGNAPTRGDAAASIKMVEYSDFQCPFCARAYPTVQQVLKDYSGKVQVAYKHFPLTAIHPRAEKAAEAAECAKDQGKFWEMHDKLFENQNDWANL